MPFGVAASVLLFLAVVVTAWGDSFSYDSTGRLLSSVQSNGLVSSFSYDGEGNTIAAQSSATDAGSGGGAGNGIADWWETQYFGAVGIDPLADPDGDGASNLLEYALGLNPTTSDYVGCLGQGTVSDAGNTYLSLSYSRPEPAPSGLSYTVEACAELAPSSWSSTGVVEMEITANATFQTITVRDAVPLNGSPRRFMRLKVSNPISNP
ncbi:MAG: RHS repeat domain-containing protein [Verrucomicrobiae bacterium]